jgi:hypothetical protein
MTRIEPGAKLMTLDKHVIEPDNLDDGRSDNEGMRRRFAAQFIIDKLLRQQGAHPRRTRVARFLGRSPLGGNALGWYRGAQGELAVGAKLAALPAEWAVFHGLPVGQHGWDIDHVVVGPGGVITINTKQHRGKNVTVVDGAASVGDRPVPYLEHAAFEGERIGVLLRSHLAFAVPIHPVLAFVEPKSISTSGTCGGVMVLDADRIVEWLAALPPVLAPLQRLEVIALLDDPASWAEESPVGTGDGLMERFTVLDAQMRAARLQRLVLAPLEVVVGLGITAVVVVNVVMLVLSSLGTGR